MYSDTHWLVIKRQAGKIKKDRTNNAKKRIRSVFWVYPYTLYMCISFLNVSPSLK